MRQVDLEDEGQERHNPMVAEILHRMGMMTRLHTSLPEFHGERELVERLVRLGDPALHVWAGLKSIPGVADIDLLLWHEAAGLFVVEVKAVPISEVVEFGYSRCRIRGREEGCSPQWQAYRAQEALQRYLRPYLPETPWMTATVCWPLASRREWDSRWDKPQLVGDFPRRMIFLDDLESDREALADRLLFIRANPPVRGGSGQPFSHEPHLMELVDDALEPRSAPVVGTTDFQRLQALEAGAAREARADLPPGEGRRLLYEGFPGTGKTFRLLQLAVAHAGAGKSVRFACFNKVLAADLRRLFALSVMLRSVSDRVVIEDVFDTLGMFLRRTGLVVEHVPGKYDDWAVCVVEKMRERPVDIEHCDTLLVDEAQDMKDWALAMLELHAAEGASIAAASGKGQEVYGKPSQWLLDFRSRAKVRELRRNFRNSRPVFSFAQAIYESGLDLDKVAGAVSRVVRPREPVFPGLLFDREEGDLPRLERMAAPECGGVAEGPPDWAAAQDEAMAAEVGGILRRNIEAMDGGERPIDLLILVPAEKSVQYGWVVRALKDLKVEFTDYVPVAGRRDIAPSGRVRLCTFHSARGLEGTRVVVFGFESIQSLESNAPIHNLAYIVLSRAVFDLVIGVRDGAAGDSTVLVETVLREIRRRMEGGGKPS